MIRGVASSRLSCGKKSPGLKLENKVIENKLGLQYGHRSGAADDEFIGILHIFNSFKFGSFGRRGEDRLCDGFFVF